MSTTSTLNSILAATSGSSSSQIDVTAAVNAVLYADRAPERAWQAQQTALAAQTSAINQIQSESSALNEALYTLQDSSGALSDVLATSSNTSVFTATATPGTASGNHTVVVNNLATVGSAYSSAVASGSTLLSSGSFSITAGGKTTNISVGSGNGTDDGTDSTLNELAATINSQSLGVTASVITDSTGARLALVAQSSGTAADFSLSNESGISFTETAATDASLQVDGVPITSATNTVSGAISGVTLNLQGASPGTTLNLSIAPDTNSITSAVNTFVSAYNTLISDVNSQFVYNSGTQTSGALASDSTISALQSDLLGATNYNAGNSATLATLNSIGISTNADGTLSVDSSTLTSAIQSNLSGVTSFFQGSDANGFVSSVETTLSTYTDPAQGAFTVDLSSISNENADLTDQINTLELYLGTVQTSLTTEYNNADIALSQLPQTLKQLDALLNPPSSSDS